MNATLWYAPEWGAFYRRGKRAGTKHPAGYTTIVYKGKKWLSHRIAFLFMTGEVPDKIDHKDRDRANCKWDNLREATHAENMMNRGDNVEHKGVYWLKARNKWRALKDDRSYIGLFSTHLAACMARHNYEVGLL